jgi:monovalent cation/proton antiporter MnhG/PhaG subunit
MREVVVYLLLALGTGVAGIACLGLLAMRDLYDRLHYLAPISLAAVAFTAAIWIEDGPSVIALKASLLTLIVLVSSPVVTHVIAQAARQRERGDWRLGPEEDVEVEPG